MGEFRHALRRVLVLCLGAVVILAFSWLGWVVVGSITDIDLTWLEILRPFLALMPILLFFAALTLWLSLVLPSSQAAGLTGAAMLLGNFLLLGMSDLASGLGAVARLTPLYYDQGRQAIPGIEWQPVIAISTGALLFTLMAWWVFQRRDIRVGGERTWYVRSTSSRDGASPA